MKLKVIFGAMLFILGIQSSFSLTQKDLEKVTWIIEKTDNYYKRNPKLKGRFTLFNEGNESKGYFLFEAPSRLKLFFGPEEAKEIESYRYLISNGNVLWIYLPQMKVLIEQEIPDYFRDMGVLGMGISRLLGSYDKLVMGEEEKDGQKLTLLTLSQPTRNVPYTEISLYIDADGFIPVMKGKTLKNGKEQQVAFYRYALNKNPEITDKDFRVRPSGEIQILRNVLVKTKK